MNIFFVTLILIAAALNSFAEVPAGVFRRGLTLAPTEIDPAKFDDAWSIQLAFQLYRRLFKINESGRLVLDLAESYDVDSAFKNHRICLKDKQKFTDGSNIKNTDVVFSLIRSASPNINKLTAYYFSRIKGFSSCSDQKNDELLLCTTLAIRPVLDNCIEIITDESTPTLPSLLSTAATSILKTGKPPKLAELKTNIYSGNYRLTYASPKKMILVRNSFKSKNVVNQIEYYFEDELTSLANFIVGDRSFARIPGWLEFDKLSYDLKKQTYGRITTTNYFFILPELPIDKRKIISELLCGFTDSGVIDKIYGKTAQKSDTIFPSRLFFNPAIEMTLKSCRSSSNKNNQIQEVHQTILIPELLSNARKLKSALEDWLKNRAPKIRVRLVSFGDAFSQYLSGNRHDILLLGFVPAYMDLEYYVREWFSEKSKVRFLKNNRSASDLADAFSMTKNRLNRYKIAYQMLQILNQQYVTVPFYEETVTYLVSPLISDFSFSHFGEYGINMDDVNLNILSTGRGE